MPVQLTFLGGAGTVTGSKYLVDTGQARLLVDCGLFQGFKQLRLRNWKGLPVDPASIDAVVLTHAHIDHSGYLPVLVKQGFKGRIHCTEPTYDLCSILLPDSGYLQEREAERANKYGYSRHKPALALYGQREAGRTLEPFDPSPFDTPVDVAEGVCATFRMAGHILGAAIVELQAGTSRIVISGDLGRPNDPIMHDPAIIRQADCLLVESTYANRLHGQNDPQDELAEIINRTAGRGGTVLIPSFAVGRAQTLLYHIYQLKMASRIPDLPVYLDSPMAIDATEIFCKHSAAHSLSTQQSQDACHVARYVHEAEDSKALDYDTMPKIIISASGMATGGRVLHHLKFFAPDARNTILFAGFQAGGTRGAALVAGAGKIKIFGQYHDVRAEVANLHMLSAHADGDEIMEWLARFETPPRQTFIVHGEPDAADTLRHRIEEELGWSVIVPEHNETCNLD